MRIHLTWASQLMIQSLCSGLPFLAHPSIFFKISVSSSLRASWESPLSMFTITVLILSPALSHIPALEDVRERLFKAWSASSRS